MRSWCVRLEAKCAARRCFRSYEIAVGQDLFGTWMVEMSYGRIGTAGRTKVRSFETVEAVQAQVRVCLRKRATAPRRIGVGYQLQHVDGSTIWPDAALNQWLGTWLPALSEGRPQSSFP
jgi:predicted DNA-binding WGR domain protein